MITILEQINISRPDKLRRRREVPRQPNTPDLGGGQSSHRSWPDPRKGSLVICDWDSYQNERIKLSFFWLHIVLFTGFIMVVAYICLQYNTFIWRRLLLTYTSRYRSAIITR